MARPTHCTPEVIEQAKAYIENYQSEHDHVIPSVVGLCGVINRARSTVYQWAENKENEFADILESINEKQQQVLLHKGLSGDFNSAITKLVLGKHGYHDKQDTTLSDPEGGPVAVSVSFVHATG